MKNPSTKCNAVKFSIFLQWCPALNAGKICAGENNIRDWKNVQATSVAKKIELH